MTFGAFRVRRTSWAGILLAAGALAACSPGSEQSTPEPAITVTHTSTPSPSVSTPPEAAALTEPGATLSADDVLTVPMIAEDAEGTRTEVVAQLSITGTEVGSIEDLADVLTPAEVDELWYQYPVFVSYTATISGPPVPEGFTITEPVVMTGTTSTGGQAAPVDPGESPQACPVMDAEELSTAGTAEGCWTLVVRYDSDLTGMEYRGGFVGSAVDYTTNPVTWEVSASADK